MSNQGNAHSETSNQTGDRAARQADGGANRADQDGDRQRQGARGAGGDDDDGRRGRDSGSATGSTADRAGGSGTR